MIIFSKNYHFKKSYKKKEYLTIPSIALCVCPCVPTCGGNKICKVLWVTQSKCN